MSTIIIPARKGSKRIPNKNFKDFCGTPMINRALNCVPNKLRRNTIVSTDYPNLDAFGSMMLIHERTKHADDESGLLEVMQDVIKCHATIPAYASKDIFVCLLPCTPLLRPESLRDAIEAYKRFHAATDEMLVSVCEYAHPTQRQMYSRLGGLWNKHGCEARRTQDCTPSFHDAGQFYIATARRWMEDKAILSDGARPWHLPRWEAVDIDEPSDWTMAEMLYKGARA